jgi:transposase
VLSPRERAKLERAFDGLPVIHTDVAGIDIGSQEHVVAVSPDLDPNHIRTFACYTADLLQLADWLASCGVRRVVMESTGVYWMTLWRILEERGFELALVNSAHMRNVPGRKTDAWDSNWLRRLHTYGLLERSFVPAAEIGCARALWRQRGGLVRLSATHIQEIQKALEQMNVQLHKVVSDVTGVTAMKIIRAIAAGERDPDKLARLRCTAVKATEQDLVKALTGYYLVEQVFILQQELEAYDFVHSQIKQCDRKLEEALSKLQDRTPPGGGEPPVVKPNKERPRKNQVHFDLRSELARVTGVDLTTIDGIDVLTAQTVVAEVGTDLSAWPSEGHFASWLGLTPNNRITGGRVRSRRTRKVRNRLADALRVSAQALLRGKSAMSAFLRRMKGKLGPAKAITATARKLACWIYRMLRYGQAYADVGQAAYEQQQQDFAEKRLRKQAATMGYKLVLSATGEVVS